jgi:hypothetical protein
MVKVAQALVYAFIAPGCTDVKEKINEKTAPLASSSAIIVIWGIRPSALHCQLRSRTHPGSVPKDGGEQGPQLLSPSAG